MRPSPHLAPPLPSSPRLTPPRPAAPPAPPRPTLPRRAPPHPGQLGSAGLGWVQLGSGALAGFVWARLGGLVWAGLGSAGCLVSSRLRSAGLVTSHSGMRTNAFSRPTRNMVARTPPQGPQTRMPAPTIPPHRYLLMVCRCHNACAASQSGAAISGCPMRTSTRLASRTM